jgi:hypothetical protein
VCRMAPRFCAACRQREKAAPRSRDWLRFRSPYSLKI